MEPTPYVEPTDSPVPSPTATVGPEPLPGDIDGDGQLTAQDALILLRHVLGIEELPEEMLVMADHNGDGEINAADALAILREALGMTADTLS